MEKQAEIREDLTPAEDGKFNKTASPKSKDTKALDALAHNTASRLSDAAEEALKQRKP